MEEQKEDKIIGFDDRNLEEDLKKYERRWFSEEFVKLYQNQNFEFFLKNKSTTLLEEWLNFKKKRKQIKNINYDIPSFLREEKNK